MKTDQLSPIQKNERCTKNDRQKQKQEKLVWTNRPYFSFSQHYTIK